MNLQQTPYARFKKTFETAHGKQGQSPFSSLLSGNIDYHLILDCLHRWDKETVVSDPVLDEVHRWLLREIDPEKIEEPEQIPNDYLKGLRLLQCMRAKIPREYGGLGMSQCRYSRLLEKIGSWSEVLALVVSVQQLGVAQGLLSARKLEKGQVDAQPRQEALHRKYLTQLAEEAIGAFCLTTPETGSDPSRLRTLARASEDETFYELNGDWEKGGKLFATLGTIADVYIMLAVVIYPGEDADAVDPRHRITAFLVDRETKGITVKPLQFCGWRGLPNAAIKLENVRVPAGNKLGQVGDGLKIAFMNLGSGRINISAIALGMMKQLARVARWWGVERVQGGKPIGEHELNADPLVDINASIYAAESFLHFVAGLADQPSAELRLEAAMLKLFSSHQLMTVADETLQLRGGRGYETFASQQRRGETAVPVERLFRSARMLQIGEGGSNVLKLYIMRCLFDDFLSDHQRFTDPRLSRIRRLFIFLKVAGHFLRSSFIPATRPNLAMPPRLDPHLRRMARYRRRLRRSVLQKIAGEYLRYAIQIASHRRVRKSPAPAIQKPDIHFEGRQVLLGHYAQIALLLSVMTVTCLRAANENHPAVLCLADEFCKRASEDIDVLWLKMKRHTTQREKEIEHHRMNILNGLYANATEQNIAPWDLPNIQEPENVDVEVPSDHE